MLEQLIQDLLKQLATPKADLEHNMRALLSEWVSQMDLVSQEELNRYRIMLTQAQQQLQQLQHEVQDLEAQLSSNCTKTEQKSSQRS